MALEGMTVKPFTYCRYIDDIFVDVADEEQLMLLKSKLEDNSVLRFTVEMSVGNRLPFLDLTVDASDSATFVTSVYTKPTDTGHCLNGLSESPDRYKESVLRAYIHRALTHCSTWALVHQEFDRIRHVLVNNNFTLTDIDNQIRRQLHKHFLPTDTSTPQTRNNIKLFYRNTMSSAYKADEKAVRDIVYRNCIPSDPEDSLKLIIYYKSPKTSSLVMNNNLSKDTSDLKATNVVYEFSCPIGDCARRSNSSYIGYTTTSLSRRLTMHLQTGAPKQHMATTHNTRLTRSILVDNTTIIARCHDVNRLRVLEAVYIRDKDPTINRQMCMRGTLLLCDSEPLSANVITRASS